MGEPEVRIRRAEARDMAVIIELWQKMMEELAATDARYALRPGADVLWAKWAGQRLRDSDSCVLVAERSDEYVGYLVGHLDEAHPIFRSRRHALLTDLYVDPGMRRKGVGTQLVMQAFTFFGKFDLHEIRVNVLVKAEGFRTFLEKFGFGDFQFRMMKRF